MVGPHRANRGAVLRRQAHSHVRHGGVDAIAAISNVDQLQRAADRVAAGKLHDAHRVERLRRGVLPAPVVDEPDPVRQRQRRGLLSRRN